jgi:serine/threonine protein kinase
LTEKVDVYSYGVILLEIVCRKFPVDPSFEEGLDIVSWTRKKLQENDECVCFLDREISFWDRDEQQKALKLLELALECTESVADKRPSMRDVVGSLIKLHDKHERRVNNRNNSNQNILYPSGVLTCYRKSGFHQGSLTQTLYYCMLNMREI